MVFNPPQVMQVKPCSSYLGTNTQCPPQLLFFAFVLVLGDKSVQLFLFAFFVLFAQRLAIFLDEPGVRFIVENGQVVSFALLMLGRAVFVERSCLLFFLVGVVSGQGEISLIHL